MKSLAEQISGLMRPEKRSIYILYVYNAGSVSSYEFDSKSDLQKRLSQIQADWKKKTILYEIVEQPDEAYEYEKARYDQTYANIVTSFLRELRASHADIPDKAYEILIDKAYDQGHSAGYDEVASYMDDLAEMYWELAEVFSADPDHFIKERIRAGEMIPAIKAYREKYKVGLREAKEACDKMKESLSK